MAKISLANILSGFSLTRINDNFQKIQDVLNDQVLFRKNPPGEDNTLQSDVDANSHRIFNLPTPVSDNEAARLKDVKNAIAGLGGYTANLISFSPSTRILSNNVQGAIEEVEGKVADIAVSVKSYGATGNGYTDDTAAIQAAINSGKSIDFGDATNVYLITSTITYTGKVSIVSKGAVIRADVLPFKFTDATGSRVEGLHFEPITTPYTISRNPSTWAASTPTRTLQGYMPTTQDADVWPGLAANIKAQFDNFHPGGIYFTVSSAAGGKDVIISGLTGYQFCITLVGYTDSTVRDCDFGGKREGIYFYNGMNDPRGFKLPRGRNNAAFDNKVKYASQCGICFFGNDYFSAVGNIVHDCGESGIKTFQHDPTTPTDVMCTNGVVQGNIVYYCYYDGLDMTNVNQVDTPSMYETGHVVVGNRSDNNRHTGITICGRYYTVSDNNCSFNGSHGINAQGAFSTITGNILRENANYVHPFQRFDLAVQGDGQCSVGNTIYNPVAVSTWNYIHTGAFGVDPTPSNEGCDIGNRCSHGTTRTFMSPSIPSNENLLVGAGTRNNTRGAIALFRQAGGGADIGAYANTGYIRVRGDGAASAQVDFTTNATDPNTGAGYQGRMLYDFTNNLFRWVINGGVQSLYFQNNVGFFPSPDNVLQLGDPSLRWKQLYAGTATISTSDARDKLVVEDGINESVLRAWGKVKFCAFRFKDAVAEKGDGARIHFGVLAQQVKEAFESEGLDPFAYGLLCYDEWEAEEASLDEEGSVIKPARDAGNRYGIRYEEALVLECAYLRSKVEK
jgi:hypothetical protein